MKKEMTVEKVKAVLKKLQDKTGEEFISFYAISKEGGWGRNRLLRFIIYENLDLFHVFIRNNKYKTFCLK